MPEIELEFLVFFILSNYFINESIDSLLKSIMYSQTGPLERLLVCMLWKL